LRFLRFTVGFLHLLTAVMWFGIISSGKYLPLS